MSPVAHVRRCPDIAVPAECRQAIRLGALVALNHSGGKDSQCMTILLARIVPREQLLVVHAPLGEVEWPGTVEHIERTIPPSVPFILAPTASGKTLLERIEKRRRWPSAQARYCTSDTKRTPIERELRRYLKARPHRRVRDERFESILPSSALAPAATGESRSPPLGLLKKPAVNLIKSLSSFPRVDFDQLLEEVRADLLRLGCKAVKSQCNVDEFRGGECRAGARVSKLFPPDSDQTLCDSCYKQSFVR